MKAKDKQAILIIVVCLIVLGAITGVAIIIYNGTKIDEQSLCPSTGVERHVVLLIDKSDKWEKDDIEEVKRNIRRVKNSIKFRERFSLKVIQGEGRAGDTQVDSIFSMCSPGSAEECNQLYENCSRIQSKYDKNFNAKFLETSRAIEDPKEASSSPILESLVSIIDTNQAQNLEIHMISDLMENGRKFRFYIEVPLADEMLEEYPLNEKAKVKVYFHVIERRRHSRPLMTAVENVWDEYLRHYGIESSFERIFIAE